MKIIKNLQRRPYEKEILKPYLYAKVKKLEWQERLAAWLLLAGIGLAAALAIWLLLVGLFVL